MFGIGRTYRNIRTGQVGTKVDLQDVPAGMTAISQGTLGGYVDDVPTGELYRVHSAGYFLIVALLFGPFAFALIWNVFF